MERHEWGWISLFNLLITPRLSGYDFSGTVKYVTRGRLRPRRNTICDDPAMDFTDVLRLFLTDNRAGLARQLRRSEMTFAKFLGRAVAVVPRFNNRARTAALSLLDPNETDQPRDLLCRPRN
ncbi:MAG: hypothetical protein QF384_08120 [Alphaproteobacteria bacterium]|nr:hypothetical protein [Alphaproteobacteria bacterium]MDP6832548.1 hypothetical protein [Alphaproteobacteria bacterium]